MLTAVGDFAKKVRSQHCSADKSEILGVATLQALTKPHEQSYPMTSPLTSNKWQQPKREKQEAAAASCPKKTQKKKHLQAVKNSNRW